MQPETPVDDAVHNGKRGFVAAAFFWVTLGMTIMPDGPFLRPHPALWRFAFACSILYELLLIYILFQTPQDSRTLLKFVDPSLGEPIPEKDYGGNCKLYDKAEGVIVFFGSSGHIPLPPPTPFRSCYITPLESKAMYAQQMFSAPQILPPRQTCSSDFETLLRGFHSAYPHGLIISNYVREHGVLSYEKKDILPCNYCLFRFFYS
jgi:hypothetical protein